MTNELVDVISEVAHSDVMAKKKPTLAEASFAYAAIQHLEKLLKTRKEALREILVQHAANHGTSVGEKGTMEVVVSGNRVIREQKTSTAPDTAKLKLLVQEKGLPLVEAFDEVTGWEMNPSKVQYLIDIGKLAAKEVDDLKSVTTSLKLVPGPKVKKALEEAAPSL